MQSMLQISTPRRMLLLPVCHPERTEVVVKPKRFASARPPAVLPTRVSAATRAKPMSDAVLRLVSHERCTNQLTPHTQSTVRLTSGNCTGCTRSTSKALGRMTLLRRSCRSRQIATTVRTAKNAGVQAYGVSAERPVCNAKQKTIAMTRRKYFVIARVW